MDDSRKVTMINKSEEKNFEASGEHGNENISKEQLDEELLSFVQQRPALYDHRIPSQERTKLKKRDLWQQVSNCLGGIYSPVDAEKRWQYLRDCYAKSRRNFKKIQSTEKRSGAAGTPINENKRPSFRYYEAMNFLNDTLEYKETCSSLRFPRTETTRAATNNEFSSPSTFSSGSASLFNDDCNEENRSPPTQSPSVSEFSTISFSSKKRRLNSDEVDAAILQVLNTNIQPSPIDGFMLRLAEGMRRLPYKERANLELQFLTILRETEDRLGLD